MVHRIQNTNQNARGWLKMTLDIDTNNLASTLKICVWKTGKVTQLTTSFITRTT